MDNSRNILIAPAWPYANGSLHLGHVGALIGADILARYHRLFGDKVLLVSGSDCYGTPIVVEAIKQGISPEEISDKYHEEFRSILIDELKFTYDVYTKTATDEHAKIIQEIFLKLYEKDFIYKKTEKALFSPSLNRFLPDRFVEGECPICHYKNARGDQCDECGNLMDPLELINPVPNSNIFELSGGEKDNALEVRESEHFYVRLSKLQKELETWVEKASPQWRTNAEKFTKGFLKNGMKDRAITRDTDWGISIPIDGYSDKKIYVWFEAVLGYFTASNKYAADMNQKDVWEDWWKNKNAVHYYVHGKDNVIFHTLILPSLLMELDGLHLPDKVFSTEYLSLEGKQFSTSRSYAVWVKDFLSAFDSELLRYFLSAHGPETSDIDFRWSEFGKLVNGELIGTFGNFVNRVCTFTEKNFPEGVSAKVDLDDMSKDLLSETEKAFEKVGGYIEAGKFRQAFREVMSVAEKGNQFIHTKETWKSIDVDRDKAETDLFVALSVVHSLSILIQPFLPKTSENMQSFFDSYEVVKSENGGSTDFRWGNVSAPSGKIKISNTKTLFKKIEDKDIDVQKEKLGIN